MMEFIRANTMDLVAAVIIDFILGDPYWFPHPIIYIGRMINMLEKKFRAKAENQKQLKVLGALIVLLICILSFGVPFILLYITWTIKPVLHIVNIFILWTTIAARCLYTESKKVYTALAEGDIKGARKYVSYIVGRDTSDLPEKEIVRAAVETVAENSSDGVIAPMLYAVIGGAPLAMLYKGINTMDSMLGYMNEKYRHIGFFPAKTDDFANFVPARLTGILICLCAPITNGNIVRSFKIMLRDRKNHKSPNCAYPEAAAAGAMKIMLGGNNIYFGELVEKPTMGDKIYELQISHIEQANRLMFGAEVLFLVIIAAIFLVM
ncbi:adenosylcobinamide-phosphate synthase CbiB [Clostridium oryzae]|uniref:Cobalamin biosynthesis protein CobD n=1 Tax=Clostridium oryzae TaxID=1450648 RepID=A0A1V4ISQ7_9CLOT|nr:adenosylcobinamide-phosphate synthase CbiB [Clostridium oryzae]OPJ63058.1 cobalamin biosynthesis protein CbiB [Clostridium oryzae]